MAFFKLEGNGHYNNARFSEASYFYQKAIIYGDYTFPDTKEEQSQMEELLQQSNCNMALCLIKLNQWEKIKIHLNETIKGSNAKLKSKGMYWLAKCHMR